MQRDAGDRKTENQVAWEGHIIRVLFNYFPVLYRSNHICTLYAAFPESQD